MVSLAELSALTLDSPATMQLDFLSQPSKKILVFLLHMFLNIQCLLVFGQLANRFSLLEGEALQL